MKHKTVLFATAALCAAVFALPAVASAGEPKVHKVAGGVPAAFTVTGGALKLSISGHPGITCTALSGSGKWSTETTGELSVKFTGCGAAPFDTECHSSGQANGVIVTDSLPFHTTYLTDGKRTPGVLITPSAGGIFATFTCFGIMAPIQVTGAGLIGDSKTPCGSKTKEIEIEFRAIGSTQSDKKVTATGADFNLEAATEGSGMVEAALQGSAIVKQPEEVEVTCV